MKYEGISQSHHAFKEEKFILYNIWKLKSSGEDLVEADLVGSEKCKVNRGRVYLAGIKAKDYQTLQYGRKVDFVIERYSWIAYCIPQLIGKALEWTTFREGKPLHELEYKLGLNE
jgi:hypothetical protein